MMSIPTENEIIALWRQYAVSSQVIAHCRLVAEWAKTLTWLLNCRGAGLDAELVAASGYLHDLARQAPDHAVVGARMLEEQGFPRVAAVIARHMDYEPGEVGLNAAGLDEAGLLYLADKCVEQNRLVGLEKRFEKARGKVLGDSELSSAVERRLKTAMVLKDRLEAVLGLTLDSLMLIWGKRVCFAAERWTRNIYLARHGAIEGAGKRYISQTDLPLCPEGIRQAERLRDRLRALPLSAFFCSPLSRSLHTVRIVCGPHSVEPQVWDDFGEIRLGEWEGLTFSEVDQRFPGQREARGQKMASFCPPGGESFSECAARALSALKAAIRATSGNIFIAGHAGLNRALLSQILGKPLDDPFQIPQEYGCLNLVTSTHGCLAVECVNDRTF